MALVFAAACGDDDGLPPDGSDGGPALDAGTDGATDLGVDAAPMDLGVDAAPMDLGADAAADLGALDLGVDAGACLDADGDGFTSAACGGDDCDDTRPGVNPGAAEVCNAGVDDDCDGLADTSDGACVPCPMGYRGPGDGDCADVDECATNTDDCDDAPDACINTTGAFRCVCPTAFLGSGRGERGCLLDDAALSDLAVAADSTLMPDFAPTTLLYRLVLAPGATTSSFVPRVAYPAHSTITVDGVVVASGARVDVSAGAGFAPRLVSVVVTTDGGVTRSYAISVVRSSRYLKAANAGAGDLFGTALALSSDGFVLAVGAYAEDSAATGLAGDGTNDAASSAGAVYLFRRTAGVWAQEAYVKPANTGAADFFGASVALSGDGSVLAVGALGEDSAGLGLSGDPADDSMRDPGAVYVFRRTAGAWAQEAYVKASNSGVDDFFGSSVALSTDGAVLAVGARQEASAATGVGGAQDSDAAKFSGAVYVFRRAAGTWSQEAYVKASNTEFGDQFGVALALSADGGVLAVGAWREDSATPFPGDPSNNATDDAGAVYVFRRGPLAWVQEAYLKTPSPDTGDQFGFSVALSADGATLAAGAWQEDSAATGLGGDPRDNAAAGSGAAFVFRRVAGMWTQDAYVKASNTGAGDRFGCAVALSGDGAVLAVGALGEAAATAGLGSDAMGDGAPGSGAAYVFRRSAGAWSQEAYVKASNAGANDQFGVAVAISADASTLAIGASAEDSAARGIGGDETNNAAVEAGAVYVF